jgi:sulfite oxidase
MDRRNFLVSAASAVASSSIATNSIAGPLQTNGAVKDSSMKVISTDPLVLETPDRLLAESRVTPTTSLFVRNHHGAKHLEDMNPRPLEGKLSITGLVSEPIQFPMIDLAKLPKSEVEMVLQCSGNFRFQFSKFSPIKGTPWNKGGIGNVRFGGVRIADVFKAAAVNVSSAAKYLTVEGADQPEKSGQVDYEKSVPLDVAMERGMLAMELNGAPLPAVHGGPLRLVIPGYYGNVQVKWLTRLRLEANETNNFFQIPDYRTPKKRIEPGTAVEYTFDNSDPNFAMKINSRIYLPEDGSNVSATERTLLRGAAWNDGAAELVAIEVSRDRGATWTATQLDASAGPYAFREWSLSMTFEKGEHTIWVRAVDALGRTQPVDGGLFWNPGGYGWNAIEKIRVIAV